MNIANAMYGPAADEMRQLVKLQTEGWEGAAGRGKNLREKTFTRSAIRRRSARR